MSTDKKSIDWYNNNANEYTNHVRNSDDSIYHAFYEKPAMYALLPDIKNKEVISLGCGSGEDSNYLFEIGAKNSYGIDIAEKLIDIAKNSYPNCIFEVMDMEKLNFKDKSFDFAYSSLAIHYIEDWTKVFKETYRILKPNSFFLFSCGHPLKSAMELVKDDSEENIRELAIKKDKNTNTITVIGNYLDRRNLTNKIQAGQTESVTTWHKSISEIIKEASLAGFVVQDFVEPRPTSGMEKVSPESYKKLNLIPEFMIIKLLKI